MLEVICLSIVAVVSLAVLVEVALLLRKCEREIECLKQDIKNLNFGIDLKRREIEALENTTKEMGRDMNDLREVIENTGYEMEMEYLKLEEVVQDVVRVQMNDASVAYRDCNRAVK